MPSDSQHMALAMGGSYWFWGFMCAAFSVAVLAAGAYWSWRATLGASTATPPTARPASLRRG